VSDVKAAETVDPVANSVMTEAQEGILKYTKRPLIAAFFIYLIINIVILR
jgi:hypothetical protein